MKIGIDISQSVYHGTGVASYTRNLVTNLLKIDKTNEYILFGSTLRRQKDLKNFLDTLPKRSGIIRKTFSLPPTVLELIWNRIHAVAVESFIGKMNVFHTSDWTDPPAQAPKVTTIHDLVVYKYPESLPNRIIETQRRKLAWVKKESGAVIADSESTKSDIVHLLEIPDEKIKVVHLGVDKNFSPPSQVRIKEVRKKYRIFGNYLLCVGTIEPRKNLERVISAFQKLDPPHTMLVIAGNPGWGNKIARLVNMKVIGFVPDDDLPALYGGAICFVYPSLYEGFGLPVLEAMSSGCPVVTSDRGSLKEIAGKATVVVNPESTQSIAEGIESILNLAYSKRRQLIEAGISQARKFSWEKTARDTLKVYESIAS